MTACPFHPPWRLSAQSPQSQNRGSYGVRARRSLESDSLRWKAAFALPACVAGFGQETKKDSGAAVRIKEVLGKTGLSSKMPSCRLVSASSPKVVLCLTDRRSDGEVDVLPLNARGRRAVRWPSAIGLVVPPPPLVNGLGWRFSFLHYAARATVRSHFGDLFLGPTTKKQEHRTESTS